MKDYINSITEELYSSGGINQIENEIWSLFIAISETESFDKAIPFFEQLGSVQFVLAKAVFKDKFEVTPFLLKFISDFDRIDDDELKKHYYSYYPFTS